MTFWNPKKKHLAKNALEALCGKRLNQGYPTVRYREFWSLHPREQCRKCAQLNPRRCRRCGCTDDDCRQCVEKTGSPCHWVESDLCSACAGETT